MYFWNVSTGVIKIHTIDLSLLLSLQEVVHLPICLIPYRVHYLMMVVVAPLKVFILNVVFNSSVTLGY